MTATPSASAVLTNMAARIAGTALISWLSGLGLHSGYHISVPFLATWAALYAALVTIGHVTGMAADSFHMSKAQAAGLIKQAENTAVSALAAKLGSARR